MLSFQEYIDAHPETIVLDPLPAIRTLLDRSKSYELIRKIEAYMKGMAAGGSAPRQGPPVVTAGREGPGLSEHSGRKQLSSRGRTLWGGLSCL